jgi:uncharacterized oligopeptide transporter (OPT) family protein
MKELWGGAEQWKAEVTRAEDAKKRLVGWYLKQEREAMRPGNIMGLFFAGVLVGAALVGLVVLTVYIIDGN